MIASRWAPYQFPRPARGAPLDLRIGRYSTPVAGSPEERNWSRDTGPLHTRGIPLTLVDLSNLEDEKEIIRLLRTRTGDETPHGLLMDVTNVHVSPTSLQVAKTHSKAILPIVEATAVVGPEKT